MKKQIESRIQLAIKEKVFPGCVVGLIKRSGERLFFPFGNFTYDKYSSRMKEDSIFDVASITKSIPTACLALKLVEERKLSIEGKIIKYLPKLRNYFRNKVLVNHLLTHTIDYTTDARLSSHKQKAPDEILDVIHSVKYNSEPGTHFRYANANSILLGLIVEKIYGDTLDVVADNILFNPLTMKRTTFQPTRFPKSDIVPTEYDDWRGKLIHGEVHDESAWAIGKKKVVGSAGLFTTAPDLLNFIGMLLSKGIYKRKRVFSSDTVQMMYQNQLGSIGMNHGLGWELYQRRFMGKRAGPNTFGKTGFTGCSVVCDIPRGVGVVILSNYIHPKRKPNSKSIHNVRSDIADIVFKDV